METPEVIDERADVFGQCYPGMEVIHRNLQKFVMATPGVKKETEMYFCQLNYEEYVSGHHDLDYAWRKFCFRNDENLSFALGVNKRRQFSDEAVIASLTSIVQSSWETAVEDTPTLLGKIEEVKDLGKENYEMILGMGFYLDPQFSDDEIEDTQYLKIVYTHSALKQNLERIRLTLFST